MDARLIIMIIMGILLMCWVIGVAVSFFRKMKKLQLQSGMVAHVKCEKCNTEYDVNAEEYTKTYFAKKYYVRKTRIKGVVLDNSPRYLYYAKKFQCPTCARKQYAEILNLAEITRQNRPVLLKEAIKCFTIMMVGGMIIMLLTGIPMSIAQKQAENQAEQMRKEHFYENYGIWLE